MKKDTTQSKIEEEEHNNLIPEIGNFNTQNQIRNDDLAIFNNSIPNPICSKLPNTAQNIKENNIPQNKIETNNSTKTKKRRVVNEIAKKACFNCKKGHRKCDNNRPCNNCKRLNKQCFDVEATKKTRKKKDNNDQNTSTSVNSSDATNMIPHLINRIAVPQKAKEEEKMKEQNEELLKENEELKRQIEELKRLKNNSNFLNSNNYNNNSNNFNDHNNFNNIKGNNNNGISLENKYNPLPQQNNFFSFENDLFQNESTNNMSKNNKSKIEDFDPFGEDLFHEFELEQYNNQLAVEDQLVNPTEFFSQHKFFPVPFLPMQGKKAGTCYMIASFAESSGNLNFHPIYMIITNVSEIASLNLGYLPNELRGSTLGNCFLPVFNKRKK